MKLKMHSFSAVYLSLSVVRRRCAVGVLCHPFIRSFVAYFASFARLAASPSLRARVLCFCFSLFSLFVVVVCLPRCRTFGSRAAARRCHRMQGGSVPGASGVRNLSPACAAAAVAPASRFASASRAATETTAKQRRSCKPEHTASAGDGAFARARSWDAASAASRAVPWTACSCGQRTRAPQHPATVGCRRRSGGHRPGVLGAGSRAPHGASA